jgi:hypothetical protein
VSDLDQYLNQVTSSEDDPAAMRRVAKQARLIFQNLIKFGRTSRLYGSSHHQAQRFLDLYVEGVQELLDRFEVLDFECSATEIRFHGEPVVGQDKVGEGMAYGLHMEGARGFGIQREVSPRELLKLAELLVADWSHRGEFEDDLVSALWRSEFENIHVDIADRFSAEDEMGIATEREDLMAGRSSGMDPEMARGDSLLVPEIQGLLAELQAEGARADDVIQMKQDEVALYLRLKEELHLEVEGAGEEDDALLRVDDAGRQALRAEVNELRAGTDADFERVGRVLFETLRLEDDIARVEEIGREVGRHCLELISSDELQGAGAFVRRVLAFEKDAPRAAPERLEAFQRGFGRLLADKSLERLGSVLSHHCETREDCGPVFTIFSVIPRSGVNQVISLGAHCSSSSLRQVLADVLVLKVDWDPEAVLTLLVTAEPKEAVIPLLALGRVTVSQAIDVCLGHVKAEESATREAALRALRKQQSPAIRAAMLAALEDPESEVRVEALRYLSVYRDRSCLNHVEVRMRSPLLGTCSDAERRAWFLAYGIIGRVESIPLLRGVLTGQFEMAGPPRSVSECAVHALVAIELDESRAALDLVARKQPELVPVIQGATHKRRGLV